MKIAYCDDERIQEERENCNLYFAQDEQLQIL